MPDSHSQAAQKGVLLWTHLCGQTQVQRTHYNCHFYYPWPFSSYALPHHNLFYISSHTKPFVIEDVNAESRGDDPFNMQISLVFCFLDNTQYPIGKWQPGKEIQFLWQEP